MQHDAGILIYRMVNSSPVFLFLKRREGWLDITKGHIEEGEDKAEAALREALEESGLDLGNSIDRYFRCSTAYTIDLGRGKREKKELTVFIAEASSGAKVTVSDEHTGYAWMKYGDVLV